MWRSLEVILNAILRGVITPPCDEPGRLFREYSEDTLHIFPAKHLRDAVEKVRRLCGEQGQV